MNPAYIAVRIFRDFYDSELKRYVKVDAQINTWFESQGDKIEVLEIQYRPIYNGDGYDPVNLAMVVFKDLTK